MDKTKLLFHFFCTLQSTKVLYTFLKNTIICVLKYYFENRKVLLDHIQAKMYFRVVEALIFQCLSFLMKLFVCKSLKQTSQPITRSSLVRYIVNMQEALSVHRFSSGA